jgi:uncharacterized protein (TIGR00251 family)
LKIKAVPNSVKSAMAGRLGNAWKVRLQAVPEGGKANKELLDFLAGKLALPRKAIQLVSGSTSREKRVRITGHTLAEVEKILLV